MATSKLIDNNRRTHAAKVLIETSKKHQSGPGEVHRPHFEEKESSPSEEAIRKQVNVIKKDIFKLREDLSRGYDLIRNWFSSTTDIKAMIKGKLLGLNKT